MKRGLLILIEGWLYVKPQRQQVAEPQPLESACLKCIQEVVFPLLGSKDNMP